MPILPQQILARSSTRTLNMNSSTATSRRRCARWWRSPQKWAADTTVSQIARTVGEKQVVDELLLRFTYNVPLCYRGVADRQTRRAPCCRGDEVRERQDR